MSRRSERTEVLGADAVVFASGVREVAMPFPGWTTPGVMYAGGGQSLIKAQCTLARPERRGRRIRPAADRRRSADPAAGGKSRPSRLCIALTAGARISRPLAWAGHRSRRPALSRDGDASGRPAPHRLLCRSAARRERLDSVVLAKARRRGHHREGQRARDRLRCLGRQLRLRGE